MDNTLWNPYALGVICFGIGCLAVAVLTPLIVLVWERKRHRPAKPADGSPEAVEAELRAYDAHSTPPNQPPPPPPWQPIRKGH